MSTKLDPPKKNSTNKANTTKDSTDNPKAEKKSNTIKETINKGNEQSSTKKVSTKTRVEECPAKDSSIKKNSGEVIITGKNDVESDNYKIRKLREFNFKKNPTKISNKIELSYITKKYDVFEKKSDKVKDFLLFRKKVIPTFWALRGISLQVKTGESIGIIGVNGSGKSTLSNIIAGIVPPTTGEVKINGEVSIISISSGLKPELTGLENIRFKLVMSGYSDKKIDTLMEDIISFSELGNQINQPYKSYSSGMKSRLGFSIMIHMDPDVMIVDEALAVGDSAFKKKCETRINQFKKQGKTFVIVSHNLGEIRRLCEKTAWIHLGKLKQFDKTDEVISAYQKHVKWYEKLEDKDRNEIAEKKRKERMEFNIDHYREQSLSNIEFESEKKKIRQLFIENITSEKMNTATIVLNVSLVILMIVLIIRQLQLVILL